MLLTITGEGDVDEAVMDVMFAGCQVKRAPVTDSETRQLGLASTTVTPCLFPQQRRDIAHPVRTDLRTGRSQDERRRRSPLAIPQFERVPSVADALRQTHVRRLKCTRYALYKRTHKLSGHVHI